MARLVRVVAWLAHGVALAMTAVLCVLLVPLVVVALLAASAQQALAPAVWKDALASRGIYERLPAIVAAQQTRQLELAKAYLANEGEPSAPGGAPPAFRDLTAGQLEAIVREVLPPAWLRAQTERALDQLLADPAPTGPVLISLVELKADLASGSATRAYVALVRAQRPCTAEEAVAWGAKVELPTCRPPEDVLERSVPAIEAALAAVARDLPDQVDVRQALMSEEEREAARAAATAGEQAAAPPGGSGLDQARGNLRLATVLPFAVAALVVLLAVRSRRALLGWLGAPAVFGGLIALALAIEAVPLVDRGAALLAAKVPAAFSPILVASGLDVARAVVERVATSLAIEAGAVAFAGVAMLLIAAVASRRPARVPATTPVSLPAPVSTRA